MSLTPFFMSLVVLLVSLVTVKVIQPQAGSNPSWFLAKAAVYAIIVASGLFAYSIATFGEHVLLTIVLLLERLYWLFNSPKTDPGDRVAIAIALVIVFVVGFIAWYFTFTIGIFAFTSFDAELYTFTTTYYPPIFFSWCIFLVVAQLILHNAAINKTTAPKSFGGLS